MPHKPCQRCGGRVQPYHTPGERQPELRCLQCGHAPEQTPGHHGRAAMQAKLLPRRRATVKLHRQGLNATKIADRLGVKVDVIRRDLRLSGLSKGAQWVSDATIQRIQELALAGETNRQISFQVGVHSHTVDAHVLPLRKAGKLVGSQVKRAKALRLLAVGRAFDPPLTYQAIARRVGASHGSVWRGAEEAGLHHGAPQAQANRARGTEGRPNGQKHA